MYSVEQHLRGSIACCLRTRALEPGSWASNVSATSLLCRLEQIAQPLCAVGPSPAEGPSEGCGGGTEFPPAPRQALRQWSCDKRPVTLIILASAYRGGSHILCLRHTGAQTHSNCSLPSSQEGVGSQGDRRVRMTRAINAARGPVGARLEASQAL